MFTVFCFYTMLFIDARCNAPAWTGNGLLNSLDDMTLECVKGDGDEETAYDVKAEGNGKRRNYFYFSI